LTLPTKQPITFEDFAAVRVVDDPQLSPDGTTVLYSVRTTDLDANTGQTVTYTIPVAGGTAKQFPNDAVAACAARWSPDGTKVAYIADDQLWIADVSGENTKQLTTLHRGASGPVWSPTSDRIAFVSRVYPDCADNAANVARAKAKEESKVKAIVADQLMFRHWDKYDDGTRAHLFVVAPDGSALADLTPGAPYDVPPGPFGGSEGYAFSPDGTELAYSAKDQGRANAWSTDVNVYTVPVTDGAPNVITLSNKGADENPVYSPDGRWIVYRSQERAGFEADQWRLMLYDRQAQRSERIAGAWDRNADTYFFASDSRTIYIQTVDAGRHKLYALPLEGDQWAATPVLVIEGCNNTGFTIARNGQTVAWKRDAVDMPAEVFVATMDRVRAADVRQLTHENDDFLARFQLYPAEEYWYTGALGDQVQGFVIKPPQYRVGRKYPVLLIIHGGPQSAFIDEWHQRWNFSLLASAGYAIVFINPHGSIGYGQTFVDRVSLDWGGAPYQDLMIGLDTALMNNAAWMDSTQVGAGGASYGGYMVNWIAGHTHRFKALFTHAGVFNLENMYGATEELWFPEWEYSAPYWDSDAMESQYRRWSPHLFAGQMRTPQLVVHGELDYRVPLEEGISLFSVLQRQNVPSRMVIFPDEGHWILKPQNLRLWYREVFAWFNKYLHS
jgi:dipeptidyl aminopeptidase/acylaminoacyl peptidase